jgi:hypothetical protein
MKMFILQEHKETVQRDTFAGFFFTELIVGLSFATKEAFF